MVLITPKAENQDGALLSESVLKYLFYLLLSKVHVESGGIPKRRAKAYDFPVVGRSILMSMLGIVNLKNLVMPLEHVRLGKWLLDVDKIRFQTRQ
jgi:hypothetical protein